jgi:hypothetical protein
MSKGDMLEDRYLVDGKIGKGSYGLVLLVTDTLAGNEK